MAKISKILARLGTYAPYGFSLLMGALISYFAASYYFFYPADSYNNEDIAFFVPSGSNWSDTSHKLEQQGILRTWLSLYTMVKLQENPAVLLPGEYRLSKAMTPHRIFKAFNDREIIYHTVTIPEGSTIKDIAGIVSKTGLATQEEMLVTMNNQRLFEQHNIPFSSLEGYVFPETYKFTKPITPNDMLAKMLEQFNLFWTPQRTQRLVTSTLTPHEIVTIASLIEKETAVSEERPLVASVIYNRLKIGMPLQIDSTVIYGIPNFNGNITKDDLRRPSPYNSYLNLGLPPSPICNPGAASLEAALNPAETDLLFFVARGDGTHQFSRSPKEHERAVVQYQKLPAQQQASGQ